MDNKKIRYLILDFPLPMHDLAFKAAEASRCAGEQGMFWEMHDRMMENQEALNELTSYAELINLDMDRFETCLNTDKYSDAIRGDMALADKLGITSTPSFVLALTDPDDPSTVKGISYIRGAQPFASFKSAIDQALAIAGK